MIEEMNLQNFNLHGVRIFCRAVVLGCISFSQVYHMNRKVVTERSVEVWTAFMISTLIRVIITLIITLNHRGSAGHIITRYFRIFVNCSLVLHRSFRVLRGEDVTVLH